MRNDVRTYAVVFEESWQPPGGANSVEKAASSSESTFAEEDGSGQSNEDVRLDCDRICVGPNMGQVQELKCKFTGVSWEGISDGEIE